MESNIIDNKWVIDRQIGKGDNGIVYKVKRKNGHKLYALKRLHEENKHKLERLRREITALITLQKSKNHPNIIKIIDTNADRINLEYKKNRLYYVMEYAEKGSLSDLSLDDANICTRMILFNQICEGVAQLHKLGIIHRDLKPDNILFVKSTNVPKVSDLGFAKFIKDEKLKKITGSRELTGTIPYMHYEQIINPSRYDVKYDFYALGKILIYLFNHEDFYNKCIKSTDLKKIPSDKREEICLLINWLLNSELVDSPESINEVIEWVNNFIAKSISSLVLPFLTSNSPIVKEGLYISGPDDLWSVMNSMVSDLSGADTIWGTASLPNRKNFEDNIKNKLEKINHPIKYHRYICFKDTDKHTGKWYNSIREDKRFLNLRDEDKFNVGHIPHHLGMDIFIIRYEKIKDYGHYLGLLLFPIIQRYVNNIGRNWEFSSGYLTFDQNLLYQLTIFFDGYLKNELDAYNFKKISCKV